MTTEELEEIVLRYRTTERGHVWLEAHGEEL